MKKGQIMGLPLILIFSLIVGAFILLYGAKVIMDLNDEADYVDFLDTIKDFENNVKTFENYDVGSSKVYSFDMPKDVEAICFYDYEQNVNCMLDGVVCSEELKGNIVLVLGSGYNIYVSPAGVFEQSRLKIEDFKTAGGNPVCVSNGGSVAIASQKGYVSIQYYEK